MQNSLKSQRSTNKIYYYINSLSSPSPHDWDSIVIKKFNDIRQKIRGCPGMGCDAKSYPYIVGDVRFGSK